MTEDPRQIELLMMLRDRGVRDTRVLEAMENVPRDLFLPRSFEHQAYADQALPIACGQTISQPFIVAFMTDRLKAGDRMKVLEVGTGSGYQTAVLSHMCRRVYTIERYRMLHREALDRFRKLNLANITAMVGDGMKGWPAQAPFERIIVTAAAIEVPPDLVEQLGVDGIMIIPVQTSHDRQKLERITKTAGGVKTEHLLDVKFVPLVEGIAKDG
ncbi:MAG: protein-L-isoaspartate(D-aspartate) O-methyltransferase [Pseudomonadota bacterium]|nr:protein-L-isoaspartate(D-aspartate) O-methyltransferase [Pseudomonadota bacterium]